MQTRRSSRRASDGASGSEYHASEKSADMDDVHDDDDELKKEPTPEYTTTKSGRKIQKAKYIESSDNDEDEAPAATDLFDDTKTHRVTRGSTRRLNSTEADDEEEQTSGRYSLRNKKQRNLQGFIATDDDEEQSPDGGYGLRRRRLTRRREPEVSAKEQEEAKKQKQAAQRAQRMSRRNASRAELHGEKDWTPDHGSSGASADADGSLEDAPHTSSDLEIEPEPEPEPEPEEEADGRPYSLRQRKEINYAIPPPLEEMPKPPPKPIGGRNGARIGGAGGGKGKSRLGWSASGKELGRWMGVRDDDSVSAFFLRLVSCLSRLRRAYWITMILFSCFSGL